VIVRDGDGNRDSDTVVVEVAEIPPGPPISGAASSPTDLDEDGRYEDVNGNGEREYDDVVVLFEGFESQSVRSSVGRFDFNANDRLDFADIVRLFEAV
jgi:alkaline phosphatase D